jgi:hypothetical protein
MTCEFAELFLTYIRAREDEFRTVQACFLYIVLRTDTIFQAKDEVVEYFQVLPWNMLHSANHADSAVFCLWLCEAAGRYKSTWDMFEHPSSESFIPSCIVWMYHLTQTNDTTTSSLLELFCKVGCSWGISRRSSCDAIIHLMFIRDI